MPELRPDPARALLTRGLRALALTGAFAALALGQGSAKKDALRFAPQTGLVLEKTFSKKTERKLERVRVVVGGAESSPEGVGFVLAGEGRVVVADEYRSVEGGRPLVLVRRFAQASSKAHVTASSPEGGDERDVTESCSVAGQTVRFDWDAGERRYAKSFAPRSPAGDAGDAALLDGLTEDMDLRAFLPASPVAPGDEWPVDGEAFKQAVLRPGGDLACASDPPESPADERLADSLWKSFAGEISARYLGQDERGLGRVAVHGTFRATADLELDPERAGALHRTVVQEAEVEGELRWDLAAGHARSMSMSSKGTLRWVDQVKVEAEGASASLERHMDFAQRNDYAIAFE